MMTRRTRFKSWLTIGVFVIGVGIGGTPAFAQDAHTTKYTVHMLPLPDNGTGDVSMDYIAFDPASNSLWVPGGNTGAVDVVDVATGKVRQIPNLPTSEVQGRGVSPSAIQQVKLNQDPYSAEFPRPGRGRIEVITKAGADSYQGSFDFTFRDASLNARDPFAATKPPEQRRIYEGVAGGPVADGKHTSFLVTFERRDGSIFE